MPRYNLLPDGYDVLRALANEGRTVVSNWRAHLYLRREQDPFYPSDRAARVLNKLDKEGLIEPLEGAPKKTLYRASGPYAPEGLKVHEAVVEAYYAGALCFGTALELHRLSDQRSRTIHVLVPRSPAGETARRLVPRPDGPPQFRLLRTHGNTHHWDLSKGGHTLALSGNAYARQEDDLRSIDAFRTFAPGAPILSPASSGDPFERQVLPGATFEIFRGRDEHFHWRFRTAMGEVVAESPEAYVSREAARASIEQARSAARAAETEDVFKVGGLLPLGTSPEDWRLEPLPSFVRLTEVGEYSVDAHNVKPAWFFGTMEGVEQGAPVRVTDVERTLLDGLRYPKHCGGLGEVFRAWVRAAETDAGRGVDVGQLVEYVERFDQLILYQRAGFVMEALGMGHPRFEVWKREKVVRGGSRVLDPDRPYAPEFDEDWALSINYPTTILEERDSFHS